MAVTMQDVADEAGVSRATVSYVLSNRTDVTLRPSTREAVLRAVQKLNYRHNALAADLRRGSTRLVGIHTPPMSYPILERKIAALERRLREEGLYPFLCHVGDVDADACVASCLCGISSRRTTTS